MSIDATPSRVETATAPDSTAIGVAGGPLGRRLVRQLVNAWRLWPLALLVIIAVIGPAVTPYATDKTVGTTYLSPNGDYWFGTDGSGFDIFSRTVAATRLNMILAALVAVASTVIGAALGLLLGMNESRNGPVGATARALTRMLDLVQAVPAILIGLVIVAFFGTSNTTLVAAMAIILSPIQARLVRTETLRVRSEAYLDAARMAGRSELHLTFRHAMPNAIGPALLNISVMFAVAIIITAALGFVGAGVPPPTPEWGQMLSKGATDAQVGRWWVGMFPALALALSVAAV
ncbi:MAG: ABC transporter permease, partial [Nocardioidaceae bacterium]